MPLYNDIVEKFDELEKSKTPISNIAHQENFTIMNPENNNNQNDSYECFHAEKNDDEFKIVLTITTRDKYRSFGNDEEPYNNTVSLYKDDVLINSKSYIYYE